MKRALGDQWPLPVLDEANRAFFTAGRLTLQRCRGCGHVQHPPEEVCERCQEMEFEDFASAGRGRVESVSVVHYPVHPALVDAVPYAVVLVSVEEAPDVLISGNVVGTAPDDVGIGNAVRAVFEEVRDPESGETLRIPQWEIAE
jgi:uncharacterized OB-fold protein